MMISKKIYKDKNKKRLVRFLNSLSLYFKSTMENKTKK